MYCRNCGKELANGAEICMNCGFKGCDGDKFCQHCGASVLPGQAMCIKCGFMLNANESPKTPIKENDVNEKLPEKDKDYKKYSDRVKKTKILALIMHIVSVITVLALIFLPIYEYKFTPQSMDDIEDIFGDIKDWDDLEKLVDEDGNIYKEFSLFEDLQIIIEGFTNKNSDPLATMIPLMLGIFAIFEVIMAVIIICISVPQILKTVDELQDIDKSTMIMFNEIKKSGNSNKKENTFKKQTVISVVLYAVFDVLFTIIEGNIFNELVSEFGGKSMRHMVDFSGVSEFMYVVIVLFVGYMVVSSMKKREENKILEDITKEEYEK